jgi:hypothetical protein
MQTLNTEPSTSKTIAFAMISSARDNRIEKIETSHSSQNRALMGHPSNSSSIGTNRCDAIHGCVAGFALKIPLKLLRY